MFALVAALLCVTYAQRECMYRGGPNGEYELNLTSISEFRLEYQTPQHFYYYTPCRNGEVCHQGNADFAANAVDFIPGENQCRHFLSVDHHERPDYFFGTAAWIFQYEDGELCDVTQAPRQTKIFMLCDEFMLGPVQMYDVEERQICNYGITIRTPLACVAENSHHANCQWKHDQGNQSHRLDLSSMKGHVMHGRQSSNGYEQYYSPCQNGLHCYQQGAGDVMSILQNRVTDTCEHYLSVWQEGRVEPLFHGNDPDQIHWAFYYYLNEKCPDGTQGEQTIRWYCDAAVDTFSVINATYDGQCKWEMNVKSHFACPDDEHYTHYEGFDMTKLVQKGLKARDPILKKVFN